MLLLLSTFTFILMSRTKSRLRVNYDDIDDELLEEAEEKVSTTDKTECLWKSHVCYAGVCSSKKVCYV